MTEGRKDVLIPHEMVEGEAAEQWLSLRICKRDQKWEAQMESVTHFFVSGGQHDSPQQAIDGLVTVLNQRPADRPVQGSFAVGDPVRLCEIYSDQRPTKIEAIVTPGVRVRLEFPRDGFYSWGVADLVHVTED